MFKLIVCLTIGHDLLLDGKCPFTENTYYFCTRCGRTIARIEKDLDEEYESDEIW
jgi:hypothetical protein